MALNPKYKAQREYYQRNKEQIKEYARYRYQIEKELCKGACEKYKEYHKNKRKSYNLKFDVRYRIYQQGAKKKGLTFELTLLEFIDLTQRPCYYCGFIELYNGLDRIDNSKGYSKDNVVPCCALCNITRGNRFTKREFELIGKVIKKIRESRAIS